MVFEREEILSLGTFLGLNRPSKDLTVKSTTPIGGARSHKQLRKKQISWQLNQNRYLCLTLSIKTVKSLINCEQLKLVA